jgi:imidazolonepropionase
VPVTAGPRWDLLLRRVHLATLAPGSPLGEARDGAVAVREGRIAWLGADRDLPARAQAGIELLGEGRWALPGFVDCHTHLVYAGNRAREHEMRLSGASYAEIARAGGGIQSTVAATRAATETDLLAASRPRLEALMAEGVTAIEIKSGYGLDLETELRMLRVARQLGQNHPVRVSTTFLGAHALPPEFARRPDDYVEYLCGTVLPAVRSEGLADAVDAFCETIGFTPAQIERIFAAARTLRLPVKLHADQLSDQGGGALAARFGALSADHLEHLSDAGVRAMAASGTVAVLLPGAFYCLRETRLPPVGALRAHGVPMAIATDCNPGTSPLSSLLLAMHMACTLFGLTPVEAIAGATREASRALGHGEQSGTLAVGKRADLVLWEIERPAELCYHLGLVPPHRRILDGAFRDVPRP